MVQIAGTYEYVSSENYEEYLKSLGLTPEQVEKAQQRKSSPLIISSADDKQISVVFGGTEKSFPLDKGTDHTIPTGHQVKTIASIKGDTVTFKSTANDGSLSEERVFTITDTGLTSTTTTSSGVVSKRVYKRA